MPVTALRFGVVGVLGFAVQLTVLAALTSIGCPWLPATIVAVECAIVHNYAWHRRWTWQSRPTGPSTFFRFNAATAVTSITGNVLLMALFVGVVDLPVVLANLLAVVAMSVSNFLIGDRWVFAAVALLIAAPASAAPAPAAIAAWNKYVAAAEAQFSMAPTRPANQPPDGRTIGVDEGTISDWHGSVFVPNVTLDAFLLRLQHPGTPPPQDDVAASRVLGRGADSLRLSIRLVRRAIVTVTYDTEHDMTFKRLAPTIATARSVATRIDEVGGGDKGFLWRLNSYWRYEAVNGGVAVTLRSLTLSRDVPFVVKPIAGRIVPRIARESIVRTLDALRAYFA